MQDYKETIFYKISQKPVFEQDYILAKITITMFQFDKPCKVEDGMNCHILLSMFTNLKNIFYKLDNSESLNDYEKSLLNSLFILMKKEVIKECVNKGFEEAIEDLKTTIKGTINNRPYYIFENEGTYEAVPKEPFDYINFLTKKRLNKENHNG